MTTSRTHLFTLAAHFGALLVALPAMGQTIINEEFKFTPDETELWDGFGESVLLSGDIAIVGVPADDFNGPQSGAVYMFDINSGQQLGKLAPDDPSSEDLFGSSVAISGNTLVVGAGGTDDFGNNSGSAYIFDLSTGQQLHKLVADDAEADRYFGLQVEIDGDTVLVGSVGDDDNGGPNPGAAYVFDATTGTQLHKLVANDVVPTDSFGHRIALDGTIAVVCAYLSDDNGSNSGSAYLFDTTTGEQIAKLLPNDGASGYFFGRSVAIEGNTIAIGAIGDLSVPSSGSVYLFDSNTQQQVGKLFSDVFAVDLWFGYSLAISGNTIAIGAIGDNTNGPFTGSVFLYDLTTGLQTHKLIASDGVAWEEFGHSVAINDQTILVGTPDDSDNGPRSGSVYVFSLGSSCAPDLTGEGDLNFLDVSAFLSAFGMQDPIADFASDGNFNFFDVSEFLAQFSAGCP